MWHVPTGKCAGRHYGDCVRKWRHRRGVLSDRGSIFGEIQEERGSGQLPCTRLWQKCDRKGRVHLKGREDLWPGRVREVEREEVLGRNKDRRVVLCWREKGVRNKARHGGGWGGEEAAEGTTVIEGQGHKKGGV